jgi:hypothetical protein
MCKAIGFFILYCLLFIQPLFTLYQVRGCKSNEDLKEIIKSETEFMHKYNGNAKQVLIATSVCEIILGALGLFLINI